jgi:hypothetical protein
MSGPLHVEIIAPIECELNILAFEFIDDRAIVDAVNGNPLPVPLVVKA